MKGKQIRYTAEQLAWIKANAVMPRRALCDAFRKTFGRTDVDLDNIKALCTRRGWKTGRTGRIEKGNIPANKGKKMPFNPNSAATQFKKGQVPHTAKWLGHERVSKDGYAEISVAETNPHTGFERRYVLKHRWLWEQANGKLPKGMALKCIDGNRLNTDPSNWQAVSRSLLPALAGRWAPMPYDEAPAELKPSLMLMAKVKHAKRNSKVLP